MNLRFDARRWCICLALAVLLAPASTVLAQDAPQLPTAKEFPITFHSMEYMRRGANYHPKVVTDEQYDLIKKCNFNLVMCGPIEQAQKHGLMSMHKALPWSGVGDIWQRPDEPVTEEQRAHIIEAVTAAPRDNPAFWGFYLHDEPHDVLYRKVREVKDIIQGVDDRWPIFVNALPGCDFDAFVKIVKPNIFAWDHYPIFQDGFPKDENIPPGFENSDFMVDMAKARKIKQQTGLPFIATMLSCGCVSVYEDGGVQYRRDYGKISETRMRWQAYSALAYHTNGIGWFIYFSIPNPHYTDTAIGKDWQPTQIYGWLQQLNKEVGVIGKILKDCRSVGAYESKPYYTLNGEQQDAFTSFPDAGLITGVDGGLVSVGEFEDKGDAKYLIIVNRNVNEPIDAKPRLAWDGIAEILKFDTKMCTFGKSPTWIPGDAPLTCRIGPGCGVVLKISLRHE